jgi:hypothetical protein
MNAIQIIHDTGNIFVALLKIFDSMKSYMKNEVTTDMLENLCGHWWIIGTSRALEEMMRTNLMAHDVILTAGKLGEYFVLNTVCPTTGGN